MVFAPIKLHDYVRLHLKTNRGEAAKDLTARLRATLAAHHAGARRHRGSQSG